jgi:hypothetical protein
MNVTSMIFIFLRGDVFFDTQDEKYPPGIANKRLIKKTIPIFVPPKFKTSSRNVTTIPVKPAIAATV